MNSATTDRRTTARKTAIWILAASLLFGLGYSGVGSDWVKLALPKKLMFTLTWLVVMVLLQRECRHFGIVAAVVAGLLMASLSLFTFVMWFWN